MVVCMKTGRVSSIVDWVFEQSLVNDSLAKYCIYSTKEACEDRLAAVIDGKLQLNHAPAVKKVT